MISRDAIIQRIQNAGVSMGKRHFVYLQERGLVPQSERVWSDRRTVLFPDWTVERMLSIERLRAAGVSWPEIKRRIEGKLAVGERGERFQAICKLLEIDADSATGYMVQELYPANEEKYFLIKVFSGDIVHILKTAPFDPVFLPDHVEVLARKVVPAKEFYKFHFVSGTVIHDQYQRTAAENTFDDMFK
jgi:DNA-binding transcriptional MerR regulator